MPTKNTFKDFKCKRGDADYVEYFAESGFRTVYQHDLGKITYMKPFRRLTGKRHITSQQGDHGRTKLLHTLEVSDISSVLARAFGLNEDLTRTIAVAHDVGQPPYGSCGTSVLRKIAEEEGLDYQFDHALFGTDEVARLSRVEFKSRSDGRFQTLSDLRCYTCCGSDDAQCWVQTVSDEVLNGIKHHTPQDRRYSNPPATLEAQVVRLADNLSYITQEIQEAIELGMSCEKYRDYDVWETPRSAGSREQTTQLTKVDLEDDELAGLVKGDILDIFSFRNGLRINVMVERLYVYNQIRYNQRKKNPMADDHSPILGRNAPILEYDPLLDFFIDFLWSEFISQVWGLPAIKTRRDQAEDNIRKLYKIVTECEPARRDSSFARRISRESSGLDPSDDQVRLAAIKYIASMTDSYVEQSIPRYEYGDPAHDGNNVEVMSVVTRA